MAPGGLCASMQSFTAKTVTGACEYLINRVSSIFDTQLEFFKVGEDKIEKCKMSNEYAKALRRGTEARPAQVCCGEDPDDESEAKRFISFTK